MSDEFKKGRCGAGGWLAFFVGQEGDGWGSGAGASGAAGVYRGSIRFKPARIHYE